MEDLGKPKSGAAQLFICFGFYKIFKHTKKEQYGNSETIENVKKLNNYFFVIEQRNYFLKLRKKEKENAEGVNK